MQLGSVNAGAGGMRNLYVSALYTWANSNAPTKLAPNKYLGMGQALIKEMMGFGLQEGIRTAIVTPLNGSEGFYLKMGFAPRVEGDPNRVPESLRAAASSESGRLDRSWLRNFDAHSFGHETFRAKWQGDIHSIYERLKGESSSP